MEDIDLKELFNYTKRKFIIIVLIVLVFLIVSFLYCKTNQRDVYKTDTSIVIYSYNKTDEYTKNMIMNEYFIRTFSEIIKSRNVLNQVIDDLDLDMSYNKLYNKVSFTIVEKTSVVVISVEDSSNKKIVDIANKIVEVLQEKVTELIRDNNSVIEVIDESQNYITYSNISTTKIVGISSVIGLAVGLLVVFMMYYFKPVKKNKR